MHKTGADDVCSCTGESVLACVIPHIEDSLRIQTSEEKGRENESSPSPEGLPSIKMSESSGFDIGDRVECYWKKSNGKTTTLKGFVHAAKENHLFVVRDQDLKQQAFTSDQLRHVNLDASGYVSAAGLGLLKPVKAWHEAGRDVDVIVDGFTALYLACDEGQVEVMRYLVEEAGAALVVQNAFGVRAFDMAFMSGHSHAMGYAMRRHLAAERNLSVGGGPPMRAEVAEHFLDSMESLKLSFQLNPVNLIRRSALLAFGGEGLPSYQDCVDHRLHVKMTPRNCKFTKTLFVSHKWDQDDDPDPLGRQYNLICNFLQKNPQIENVFISYSCLPPMPNTRAFCGSSQEGQRMMTLLVVIFICSHCLVVPRLAMMRAPVPSEKAKVKGIRAKKVTVHCVSNVKDFLTCAKCMWEFIIAMLSGCDISCAFLLDNKVDDFVPLPAVFCYTAHSQEKPFKSFKDTFLEHALRTMSMDQKILEKFIDEFLDDVPDPMILIVQVCYCIMSAKEDRRLMNKILSMGLLSKDLPDIRVDLLNGEGTLWEVANLIGQVESVASLGPILNSLMILVMYAMNRLPGPTTPSACSDKSRTSNKRSHHKQSSTDAVGITKLFNAHYSSPVSDADTSRYSSRSSALKEKRAFSFLSRGSTQHGGEGLPKNSTTSSFYHYSDSTLKTEQSAEQGSSIMEKDVELDLELYRLDAICNSVTNVMNETLKALDRESTPEFSTGTGGNNFWDMRQNNCPTLPVDTKDDKIQPECKDVKCVAPNLPNSEVIVTDVAASRSTSSISYKEDGGRSENSGGDDLTFDACLGDRCYYRFACCRFRHVTKCAQM